MVVNGSHTDANGEAGSRLFVDFTIKDGETTLIDSKGHQPLKNGQAHVQAATETA